MPPKQINHFNIASDAIARLFEKTSDEGTSASDQVVFLLQSQVDYLAYQGNFDPAGNTAGSLRWANSLVWKGQPEFDSKSWKSVVAATRNSEIVGMMKEVSVRTSNTAKYESRFALVAVDNAGHFVSKPTRYKTGRTSTF